MLEQSCQQEAEKEKEWGEGEALQQLQALPALDSRFFYYNSNLVRLVFSNCILCILNDVPSPGRSPSDDEQENPISLEFDCQPK